MPIAISNCMVILGIGSFKCYSLVRLCVYLGWMHRERLLLLPQHEIKTWKIVISAAAFAREQLWALHLGVVGPPPPAYPESGHQRPTAHHCQHADKVSYLNYTPLKDK